jgi:uncharacterized protein (TIGR04222 family)
MLVTETPGNTWAISGPAFLAIYLGAGLVTFAAIELWRRAIWARSGVRTPTVDEIEALHPCDVALLRNSRKEADRQTSMVALMHLERTGVIELVTPAAEVMGDVSYTDMKKGVSRNARDRRRTWLAAAADVSASSEVELRTRPTGELHPIERAELAALDAMDDGAPRRPADVMNAAQEYEQFDEARDDLVARGWLPDKNTTTRLWMTYLVAIPLLVLGIVRLVVGIQREKPVGFLMMLLFAAAVLLIVRKPGVIAPTVSKPLKTLGKKYEPASVLAQYEPAREGDTDLLVLALIPAAAVWGVAPTLAATFDLPKPSSGGGAGGGCGGGGCGGGGCGG